VTEMSVDHEPLLHPDDVAVMLSVNRATLYRWWRQGTGPPYVQLPGKVRRCRLTDVRQYIENQTERSPS